MPQDPVIVNLLISYAAVLAMNAALSGALWLRHRTPLHLALVLVWLATALSFVVQGALSTGTVEVALGFASVFAPNYALAHLVAISFDQPLRPRLYILALLAGCAAAVGLAAMGFGFTVVALPVVIPVCLPLAVTSIAIIRSRWSSLSVVGKALMVSCLAFCAHNLDFAVLRAVPEAAAVGFTIALFIITALSITAPAVVLEILADSHARKDAELGIARRVQNDIIPRQTRLGDLEVACYLKSADSVGGDYLDVHEQDGAQWLLLGDVTGHGLGAGLVMLMAQSTVSALFHSRPDIEPAELNFIANRVLYRNLARLNEKRHMTIVALKFDTRSRQLLISGSHDNIYIYRADTGTVDSIELNHFPLGLGFVDDSTISHFRQDDLTLGERDVLLAVTDGVTEAARGGDYSAPLYGEDRLRDLLSKHASADTATIKSEIVRDLDHYTDGVYSDDVALLVAKLQRSGRTGP